MHGRIDGESIVRFFVHVAARSLVLNEVHSLILDVSLLGLIVHAGVLLLHVFSIGLTVLPFRNLEQFLLTGVNFHQLNPMTHTSQEATSLGVSQ